MPELNNLSAPIEQSPEEKAESNAKIQKIQNEKIKAELKLIFENFKRKYLSKLLISLGIAVVVCIALVWIIDKLFSPDVTKPTESVKEISQETAPINQGNNLKYRKLDGHQYFFYVPEDYSFLNRTRNEDLNEIVFSDKNGKESFLLQEFEADNDSEGTLDSIYSYIETTLAPVETRQVEVNGNTFKARVYNNCSSAKESSQTAGNTNCGDNKVTYYSIYINGILVLFRDPSNIDDNDIASNILNTFTKNTITTDVLSENYIIGKIPFIKTKLQAEFAFGPPQKTSTDGGITTLIWKTNTGFNLVLQFNTSKSLISAKAINDKNLSLDLLDKVSFQTGNNIYSRLYSDAYIISDTSGRYPDISVAIDDHIKDDNYWEVTISNPDTELVMQEYQVDKSTEVISRKK